MHQEMTYGEDYRRLPLSSIQDGRLIEAAPHLWCKTIQIVNVGYVQDAKSGEWILIDAGMPGSAEAILAGAAELFGEGSRPAAIVLTHGHFDHVGAVIELIRHWETPVYAHSEEQAFLTGKQGYAPADTAAGGGLVSQLAALFPNEPIDLGDAVRALPEDGSVPGLAGWRWLATPGHTAGHVSLFREEDRTLIAGDAFVTVKQESVYQVLTQHEEISGPPRYFTADWVAARRSVEALAALQPSVAVCGHGRPMAGDELRDSLHSLVDAFEEIAVPPHMRTTH